MNSYEKILFSRRGWISKTPENKTAVMIVSGGLDSITTTAMLIKEYDLTIYPLHIERGQTNLEAEVKSIKKFMPIFTEMFPGKIMPIQYIKLNVPPMEIKNDLLSYTKRKGHPLRDTMLQLAAAQYAVSLEAKGVNVRTIYCAVMPEDYFPHSNLESIRATNVALCQNTYDWEWLITSPNIDTEIRKKQMNKSDEIKWAHDNNIPIEYTISCNVATEFTAQLNCGSCASCERRKEAFAEAGLEDKTKYFSGK